MNQRKVVNRTRAEQVARRRIGWAEQQLWGPTSGKEVGTLDIPVIRGNGEESIMKYPVSREREV